jgi:uncharacterized membrane protein
MDLNPFNKKLTPPVAPGASDTIARQYEGEDLLIAAVSYIPFLSAGVLLLRKQNSEFVSYHAKMAIVLLVFTLLAFGLLPGFLRWVGLVAGLIVSAYSAYKAYKGDKLYIPLISKLAQTIEI